MPKHIHCDMIVAWANGEKIQFRSGPNHWYEVASPNWDIKLEYRIKPKEPLVVVQKQVYLKDAITRELHVGKSGQRVAWELDPDTKRIISVTLLDK
jgi:hypothetical protein